MDSLFQRHDLAQCEALVKGNLCTAISCQSYQTCKVTFAQFTNRESKQRVFCLLLLETEVICVINPLLDINPKPYDPKLVHKFKPNQLVISKVDGKYCAIKCSEKAHFVRLQVLLCDALAESICCDSMKPLQSGRLSASRLTRCVNTCKLLTQDVALVQQVTRLKSIRRQINNTLQTINKTQCVIPSPEVRKVRAGCNFIQRIYPTFRCDPDLLFLTEQLRGGKHSAEDLESICRLLLQVEHEDKAEFMRMVKASSPVKLPPAPKPSVIAGPVTLTMGSKKNHSQHLILSPSKRLAIHKKVSWDSTVRSNDKNVRPMRRNGRHITPVASSMRRPTVTKTQQDAPIAMLYSDAMLPSAADLPVITTPTKSMPAELVVTATPVPNAVLHARIVSPNKRNQAEKAKQKPRLVPSTNLWVIIGVLIAVIAGIWCVYRSWPQYSALTFSTPSGVTTVSISVSSAVSDTTKLNAAVPAPTQLPNPPNLLVSTDVVASVPPSYEGSNKQSSNVVGSIVLDVQYAEKMQLSPVKNTLNALSKMVLSPIKFVKLLFRNAMRVFGRITGAK